MNRNFSITQCSYKDGGTKEEVGGIILEVLQGSPGWKWKIESFPVDLVGWSREKQLRERRRKLRTGHCGAPSLGLLENSGTRTEPFQVSSEWGGHQGTKVALETRREHFKYVNCVQERGWGRGWQDSGHCVEWESSVALTGSLVGMETSLEWAASTIRVVLGAARQRALSWLTTPSRRSRVSLPHTVSAST